MIGELAFWLVACALCLAPFIPALLEWRLASDAEPLVVVRAQDTNIRHFAHSFFDQVQDFFAREGIDPTAPPAPFGGDFRAGQAFEFLGNTQRVVWSQAQRRQRVIPTLLIATGDLILEGGFVYEQEIYCGGQLYVGSHATFRAVYAGTDLILGESCTVARWLHSQGHVHIGANSVVYGRISSASSITLSAGTRFERLNARNIRFASDAPPQFSPRPPAARRSPWELAPGYHYIDAGTVLGTGRLSIPAESRLDHNLVVKGELFLGPGCHVAGKLKAHERLRIGAASVVVGAIVCEGPIVIGDGCLIQGPIISETEVIIAGGCLIGTPQLPTTVTAPTIRVAPGCEISGSLWATVSGTVIIAPSDHETVAAA